MFKLQRRSASFAIVFAARTLRIQHIGKRSLPFSMSPALEVSCHKLDGQNMQVNAGRTVNST
jgi:hypothetical protein